MKKTKFKRTSVRKALRKMSVIKKLGMYINCKTEKILVFFKEIARKAFSVCLTLSVLHYDIKEY